MSAHQKISIITGFDELLNHPSLSVSNTPPNMPMPGCTTSCCATGTCS